MIRTLMYTSAIIVLSMITVAPVIGADPVEKKLIEFGWDEPDPAFMRKHIKEMQLTPFDGCVFHVGYKTESGNTGSFTWDCWGKQAFKSGDLSEALADLKATQFGQFSHNFLRFNVTPGDVDWFDDFSAIVSNARVAATFAREAGLPGILFDIEQYIAPLFDYQKQPHRDQHSWGEYQKQVRQRGREVMAAFQEGYPDLKVFLTFGYVLPWEATEGKVERLRETGYGLIASFFDGMYDAANGKSRIIDGCESAYRFKKGKTFENFRRLILREVWPMVGNRDAYVQHVGVSFGLWMDYDYKHAGWNTEDLDKNPRTPELMEELTKAAIANADEYVWIYSEMPRWWTDKGVPEKLPLAYVEAIRRARHALSSRPASHHSP